MKPIIFRPKQRHEEVIDEFGNWNEKTIKAINKYLNEEVKILSRARYSGKGKPKKIDYNVMKRKDINDYIACEFFHAGFKKTNYV